MSNKISVLFEKKKPEWAGGVRPFLKKVLEFLGADKTEISVLFCEDDFIQKLNKEFRKKDEATDVLSFESGEIYADKNGSLWKNAGDIAISVPFAKKNAEIFGEEFGSEIRRLLVHGVLHLFGMDHGSEHIRAKKIPKCEMLLLQEKILRELDFSDQKIQFKTEDEKI